MARCSTRGTLARSAGVGGEGCRLWFGLTMLSEGLWARHQWAPQGSHISGATTKSCRREGQLMDFLQEDKDLPAAVSMLVRSAALTGRVWLDVHLEDVSRLGAPTSAQLLVDLRRIVYRLLGRDTITETRSDHSGVTSSKIVLDPQKLPPAEDLLRWPWSHRWQMFRSIVEHHLLDTTKGEGEQATPVETAVFEAFEARKSDDQVPDWAHGAFAAMVLEYVASLNRRPEPTMLREHEFDSLAATIALSCEISLPGAPLAKASPQLQEKLAHVKMIMSQVITTHFHANAEVRMPTRGIAVSTYFQASAHLLMDIARLLQLDADFGQGAMVRVPQCRPWAFGGTPLVAALPADYVVPKVWEHTEQGGTFGGTNRPYAGAWGEDKPLPKGEHKIQLYSMATPNGVKATIFLEELVDALPNFEYDAWFIPINGAQFTSGFHAANPNSKIPAMMDYTDSSKPVRVFESGSILLYLADKFDKEGRFFPKEYPARAECQNWLMWQMGTAPFLGGGFGHFYHYAPVKIEYAINRYAMETKRLFDVLDKHLGEGNKKYVCGDQYTIADMAIFPWIAGFVDGIIYGEAQEFLQVKEYKHLCAWSKRIGDRAAVKRGVMVNRAWGEKSSQLHNGHARSDFQSKTQDKLEAK
ncbi:Disulfide-bond oxidoreductase YghU (GSH-dependent disulfide-bond oxidoreductase YghU) (GST N2-2) (Organic hydroperoxidase) [Durusdinium trenchii]|uniref:Disulfide-bond oxidoreductase YghU (GSH-dependent disulfide-bond oxidoreductase YghU) (GST N2-2) (Organic hydroperoxidase) n=1 Tax=Durusdinium trenchii TaxID=1381693 RepID=A0ABP0NH52_9DINO